MPNDLYRSNHPGSSGNYIDTDDVNLFDSTTAHAAQDTAGSGSTAWVANGVGVLEEVEAGKTSFGPNSIKVTLQAVSSAGIYTIDTPGSRPPVTVGNVYTVMFWVQSAETIGTQLRARVDWVGAGASNGSGITIPSTSTPTLVSVTATAPSGATALIPALYTVDANANANAVINVSAFMVAVGTHTTFKPSLRIIGDADIRYKMAADDWGTAGKRNSYTQRGSQYGFYDSSTTAGTVRFQYVSDTGAATANSDVLDSFLTAGVAAEIKHEIEWGVGWRMYIDDTLRSTKTLVGTEFAGGAADLTVGGQGTLFFDGDIYWVEIRDGIGGPIVRKYDAQLAFEAA